MKLTGIIITDTKGRRVSFARATARYSAKLLSYYSFLIGFFLVFFTRRRQTLHDLVARTVVLRRRSKVTTSKVEEISAHEGTDISSFEDIGLSKVG
jgi:uncharacterized RDD family membrane protein YckC